MARGAVEGRERPAGGAAGERWRWQPWALAGALLTATLLAYQPALGAGFIWNDLDYVTAPHLRSTDGLARIWFELGATEQYYPLLHSFFWLQHRLWGDAPGGYHLTNVCLHAIAAGLLAGVLRRLAIPGAVLAAFVFALHPVYVESVAWISEQKNTLSLVFYLAAAWAYLSFERSRSARTYALASVCFLAALASKSVTASLPAALLVVAWWRDGRIGWREVRPLVPWFVAGTAMGVLSAHVERTYIGAQGEEFALSGLERSLLAGRIAWFYVGKFLWPANLIFIYPRWDIDAGQAWQWGFSVAVLGTLAGLFVLRKRTRAPLAAVLFFGGSLVPTLGFFNVYAFLYSFVADHWQYLPSLGLLTLASAAGTRLVAPLRRGWRMGLAIGLVAALAGLTLQQSRMYADMRTFYAATLARNPACWMAHNNLANLLREAGELEAARTHLEAALRVRPGLYKVYNNLGNVCWDLGRREEALAAYAAALEIRPEYGEASNNLGRALVQLKRPAEAVPHLFAALRADPANHDARNNLGMALRELGRLSDAIRQFARVTREQPDMAPAHLNLALALSLAGRTPEAMEAYREARRLNPALPELR